MMKTYERPQTADCRPQAILRSSGGQSLLLALMVMFLLVFVGGLFIAIVGRNIMRATRSGEVLSVQYLAEAGIRYADHQLTYSEDGADWRPVPDYPLVTTAVASGQDAEAVVPAQNLPNIDDPDYTWLVKGFSRYSYGKGRFLLRVTYDPRPDDPMSKFIKVESIGRMGVVDANDPTTFQNRKHPVRLRKELVAYKPIAITDYARFITNKDRRPNAMPLGAPDFITTFGEQPERGTTYGAPIRVNGDLLWHGKNIIWLDTARGQAVEVAGDIHHEDTGSVPTLVSVNAIVGGSAVTGVAEESSHGGFTTAPVTGPASLPANVEIGWYRDGSPREDIGGRPREITRLDPPNLDAIGVSGRLSRYREVTRNSGDWRKDAHQNWYNTGYYGWGDGIYIDNTRDIQTESVGYTLRADWTQPGSSQYWHGPYYDPPGISVVLLPYDADGADRDNDGQVDGPDIMITRDESNRYIWSDPDGNPLPETGERIIMPYPKNGVLFAEGNIRIKGMLAPGKQLTVVSGGTIYIDGNVLKYRDPQKAFDDPTRIDPTCTIALLATDYVCVNPTQFFGPLKEVPYPGPGAGFFDVSSTSAFWFNFAFGEAPESYAVGSQQQPPIELLVRHSAAPGGASYMNMLINWPPRDDQVMANAYHSFYRFDMGATTPVAPWNTMPQFQYIYPLGDMMAWPMKYGGQQYESWEHQTFGLWPLNPVRGIYDFHTLAGVENKIGFQIDQSTQLPSAPQDYYVSRAAVQPLDIRVEAMMYAQNKSFFVIPGEWFNPDPEDLPGNGPGDPNMVKRSNPDSGTIDNRWPFYGQPIDVRITVFGAISENVPANIGDVSAWMEKWGWIPIEHGNSGQRTSAYRPPLDPDDNDDPKRKGLTIIYDDLLSHPVVPAVTGPKPFAALRFDEYGRPLPIAPKLPVSPQTIYMGKPS